MKVKLLLILIVGILILTLFPLQTVSAQGGDAAKLDSLSVVSIPPTQSAGGEVEIRVKFNVYGGCCYHLWVYDAYPEVDFPPEFVIYTGPEPEMMEEIDGLPGGEPCPKYFSWTGTFTTPGTYKITAKIVSDNSGTIEGESVINVLSGPAISAPKLFPSLPDTAKELQISMDVISPSFGVDVTSVKMYQLISDKKYDNAEANLSMLTVYDGDYSRTFPGTEKELQRSEKYPNTYKAVYPPFKEKKYIYYWIVAEDSEGMVVSSSVNEAKIQDIQGTYTKLRVVFFSFLLITLLGIFLIIFIHMKMEKRQVKDKTRLYRLGSNGNVEYMKQKDRPRPNKTNLRYVVFIVLSILAILIIIYAYRNGGIDSILQFIQDGK